jgi:hypothetical protein
LNGRNKSYSVLSSAVSMRQKVVEFSFSVVNKKYRLCKVGVVVRRKIYVGSKEAEADKMCIADVLRSKDWNKF